MKAITNKELFDLLDQENLTLEQIFEDIMFLEGRVNFHLGRKIGTIDVFSREILNTVHEYQIYRSGLLKR